MNSFFKPIQIENPELNKRETKAQLKNNPYMKLPDLKELKIWSWNVNGIRAVLAKNRIQQFFSKARPDILCI